MKPAIFTIVVLVAIFSGVMARSGKTPRDLIQPVFDSGFDLFELGNPGDPNNKNYREMRKVRRAELDEMASYHERNDKANPVKNPLEGGLTPEAYYDRFHKTAEFMHGFKSEEEKLWADSQGTRLRSQPLQVIPADAEWIHLHAQVFEGDEIWVGGSIHNELLDILSGHKTEIGPDGIGIKKLYGHTAYNPDQPMYKVLGRVNGREFPVGRHAKIPFSGWLEVMTNIPSRDGMGVGTLVTNRGRGQFTILRLEHRQ